MINAKSRKKSLNISNYYPLVAHERYFIQMELYHKKHKKSGLISKEKLLRNSVCK